MLHKRVRFKGQEYWLHSDEDDIVLLSPIDHFSEDGELLANPFTDISYAVLLGDDIVRFNKVIGSKHELVEIQ